ncbi:hypothetical protein IMSAGC019_01825 [Lachnospiraceae bacterium]|nr:hypothetical protein IMSAGC019_01825 [Lachnospiraceae bacterium]
MKLTYPACFYPCEEKKEDLPLKFQTFPAVSVKAAPWPKLSLWVLMPHPAGFLTNWRTENPRPKQAHWKALSQKPAVS